MSMKKKNLNFYNFTRNLYFFNEHISINKFIDIMQPVYNDIKDLRKPNVLFYEFEYAY